MARHRVDPLLHEKHPVRVLIRRARRHAWDDAVNEAFGRGLMREQDRADLLASNPWRDA